MKKLFSNKKIQIISTVVMGLIFILLFTRGIPYGIKISSESVHDKCQRVPKGTGNFGTIKIHQIE